MRDGFDVHHIDGNHANDDPKNLVLIEGADHMMLHGGRITRLVGQKGQRGPNKRTLRKLKAAAFYERFIVGPDMGQERQ